MAYLDNDQTPRGIVAPTGGVTAATCVLIQNVLYYCPEAIAATETGTGYWKDVVIRAAPKATGVAWTVGLAIYWDNSAAKFTTVSTSNTLRGFAVTAAASGDTTGDVQLIGNVA